MAGYFITGTDTGVGKTCVSLALMQAFKSQGKLVAGMKPVSAGCSHTKNGLRNDDAVKLQDNASIDMPYNIVNPYAYEPSIAPHIAAQELGDKIALDKIAACYDEISKQSEVVIVEGAGGWLVPINDTETMADIAIRLQLPVVLVVGMRLGCLNHSLLSEASIRASGLTLAGWVANHASGPMEKSQDNIESLQRLIPAPLLAVLPYNANCAAENFAQQLDIVPLEN
ncbi:dethiobiotin synthase [Kaarinaea lacus]